MSGVVIPEDATTKHILAALDVWGTDTSHKPGPWTDTDEARRVEQNNMWRVLTALRGPDSGDDRLKDETTAWIRAASLPNLAYTAGAIVAGAMPDGVDAALEKLCSRPYSADHFADHFAVHVKTAARALVRR